MTRWYQAGVKLAPPPTWVTLEWITEKRVDLYRYVPPPGENTTISFEPFQVQDLVPTEYNIEWAVKRLENHRYGGPSGMQTEHLKGWLVKAQKEEEAAAKAVVTEGTGVLLGGTGGEDTEEKKEKASADMTNW